MNVVGGVKETTRCARAEVPREKRVAAAASDSSWKARSARGPRLIVNLTDQQKIRIGSCAWSFDEWNGPLYPPGLPSNRWLEFYARHFPTVEIDSTFYSAPAEATAQRWVEMTPANFRFTCKLPRELTHDRRLHDCRPELLAFLRALEPLAPKLPVVLIQLPPSYRPKEERTAFRDFITQLPGDFRFAVEFRDSGWHQPSIIRLLEKHRICWVWSDTTPLNERNLAPFEFQPLTTDFLYLRLLGHTITKYDAGGKRIHRYDKLLWKREAALDSWALRIQRQLDEIRNVWTFVNNHYEGFAPATCQRLAERLGFELALPSPEVTPPNERGQLDLFAEPPPAA